MLMAIFRDRGSALATLRRGKAVNVYGRLPGHVIERVDAEHGPRLIWHARHSDLNAPFPQRTELVGDIYTLAMTCASHVEGFVRSPGRGYRLRTSRRLAFIHWFDCQSSRHGHSASSILT